MARKKKMYQTTDQDIMKTTQKFLIFERYLEIDNDNIALFKVRKSDNYVICKKTDIKDTAG